MWNRVLHLKECSNVHILTKLNCIPYPTRCVPSSLNNVQKRWCSSPASNISEGASEFLPVALAQNFLESVHHYSHLPWWSTIILTCLGLRAVITLPLAVHQNKLITKIELLQPTLKELSEALKHRVTIEGRRSGLSSQAANRDYRKKLRKFTYDLYSTNGCNPIKLYTLPWAQIPLWIVLSLALRNLCGALRWDSSSSPCSPHSDMSSEGVLWFPDLTVPDPTGVLPVFLGLTNLANIELHALKRTNPTTKQRIITMVLRSFSICMIAIAYKVPAIVPCCLQIKQNLGKTFGDPEVEEAPTRRVVWVIFSDVRGCFLHPYYNYCQSNAFSQYSSRQCHYTGVSPLALAWRRIFFLSFLASGGFLGFQKRHRKV